MASDSSWPQDVLSLRSFRILLTPLTNIPVGEAHHFAIDALRKLSTSYAFI
jgi:hypothetical protein